MSKFALASIRALLADNAKYAGPAYEALLPTDLHRAAPSAIAWLIGEVEQLATELDAAQQHAGKLDAAEARVRELESMYMAQRALKEEAQGRVRELEREVEMHGDKHVALYGRIATLETVVGFWLDNEWPSVIAALEAAASRLSTYAYDENGSVSDGVALGLIRAALAKVRP